MYDEETQSLWSHLLGKCMQGGLKGQELEIIPSVMTDWSSWKKLNPGTTVMNWPQRGPFRYDRRIYNARSLKKYVVGIKSGQKSKSYRFDLLKKNPLVNDSLSNRHFVIWFDSKSGGTWSFDRKTQDYELVFQLKDGLVIDQQTGSRWDLQKGVATSGPLKGQHLAPRIAIPSFAQAWDFFYPKSEKWDGK